MIKQKENFDSVVRNFRTTEFDSYQKKTDDELSEVEKQFIESIEKAKKKLKVLKPK